MTERRHPRVKIGRRASDIPIVALEKFQKEMKVHVAKVIIATVNGKIDDLKKTTLTKDDFNAYVAMDTIRWADAKPSLDNMKNITSGWKVVLSLFGSIAVIAGGIITLRKLLNL